ncbi:MAG: hypothetical protein HY554_13360 [Elusimicrobia bacterium]|nr:hypothetical protein [Elusimicrobiota bacterium]
MVRQLSAMLRLLCAVGLLFGLVRVSSAQQVYINSLWVSAPTATTCIERNGKYFCKAPSNVDGKCPSATSGNISNNPHIEFDQFLPPASSSAQECQFANTATRNPFFAPGSTYLNYCNSRVMLCLSIGFGNDQSGAASLAIDKVGFELFKFTGGANALNPETTPPVRTFSIDNPGTIQSGIPNGTIPSGGDCPGLGGDCGYCVMWDGAINIAGELGKSNGQYGFRGTVETNQTGANGNITITQTRPYPSGATLDCSCFAGTSTLGGATPDCGPAGTVLPGTVLQQPVTVDVVNVHNVRSSATIVGSFSGVLAQPYGITYRLGKDAITSINVHETDDNLTLPQPLSVVRKIVDGLPRVGEGVPDGTLQNGDAWNGREDNGALAPPGVYLVTLQAQARDQFGLDLSAPVTRQISLDPLQITDILVQPLAGNATSLAVLTYTLTEPATTYVDIYPPGTQFCNGLNSVNDAAVIPDDTTVGSPPKRFRPKLEPTCGATASEGIGTNNVIAPIRRFVEQKDFRKPVVSFWDGRDSAGEIMPDGDYVFVIYGALPSVNGPLFGGDITGRDRRIWTSTAKSGFITIARGHVTISQVTPATTVIGSSPSVAGLNPFIFSYSLSRDALVSLRIFDETGLRQIRQLVNREVRPANFLNREIWTDAIDDNGLFVSSGNYLVELSAADPFFPAKVTTTTALFQANPYRITDVFATPLQSGSTENVQLSYQLSQTMNVSWNIYPPGTVIAGSSATWPPCATVSPGLCGQTLHAGAPTRPLFSVHGLRPGRLRITEFWDGRDQNGLFVPDGSYVYTVVAQSTTTPKYFASDRIIGLLTITRGSIVFPIFTVTPTVPPLFNSSATLTLPPYELDYSVTRQSSMTIHILTTDSQPRVARTLISGQVRDANLVHKEFWDGRDDRGSFVSPGFYTIQAIASDLASALASGSTVQQTIAVDPLRVYDVAVSPLRADEPTALISYQVSETMKVAVKIFRPGTSFDQNANPSPPEAVSLVRRIVGLRAARTEITEVWDGRDHKLSLVPDGNYLFKIMASTDIAAIDSITGNVAPGASLAEDIPISEIPVVRGGSVNPLSDFEDNTFVYPNPVTTPSATFNIYVPIQSRVSLKIFNIAGELVYERQFGEQASDTYVQGGAVRWNKVNSAGRPVARGVYFAIIREEETLGARNVFQTIKKILIQ